jgi:hypothetical protein
MDFLSILDPHQFKVVRKEGGDTVWVDIHFYDTLAVRYTITPDRRCKHGLRFRPNWYADWPSESYIAFDMAIKHIVEEFVESKNMDTTLILNAEQFNYELTPMDKLCIKWVNRIRSPRVPMYEFLEDHQGKDGLPSLISVDQFKKALQNAGNRSLIVKSKTERWVSKNRH